VKKKLANNLPFLAVMAAMALAALSYAALKKAGLLILAGLGLFTAIAVHRICKVTRKAILEYLNGPERFCKGKGIEIGSGGAPMVKGSMLVDIIDNFSRELPYKVDYFADAHDLAAIKSSSLDYVCASHVLEHMTNPIRAIREWVRVLRPGGIMWLRIPDKRKTFDRRRERTPLGHLIEDFERNVPVDDPTHIEDFKKKTDPPRDQGHPYVHNHVWVKEDIIELFGYLRETGVPLKLMRCEENTRDRAEDFWLVAMKEA